MNKENYGNGVDVGDGYELVPWDELSKMPRENGDIEYLDGGEWVPFDVRYQLPISYTERSDFVYRRRKAQPSNQWRKYRKVIWRKLNAEPVAPGDMWAAGGTDPNSPERQGESSYNLQMQAIHPNNYGVVADDIGRGNGDYWRPIGVVDAEIPEPKKAWEVAYEQFMTSTGRRICGFDECFEAGFNAGRASK